jgi:hypothetical protein
MMIQPMYNLVQVAQTSRLDRLKIKLHVFTGFPVTLAAYSKITGPNVPTIYIRDLRVLHNNELRDLRSDSRPTPFPFGARRFH